MYRPEHAAGWAALSRSAARHAGGWALRRRGPGVRCVLPAEPPPPPRLRAVPAGVAEPRTEEAWQRAVAALVPYLHSYRSRLAAAAAGSPGTSPDGKAAPPEATETGGIAAAGEGKGGGGGERSAALRALVDTALTLALLRQPDGGALLRLLSRPNDVDVRVSEAALRAAGRYSELVALFQVRLHFGSAAGPDLLNLGRSGPGLADPTRPTSRASGVLERRPAHAAEGVRLQESHAGV